MRAVLVIAVAMVFPVTASAQVYVQGYTKSNGTYVAPHYRSNPDGNRFDNYSTRGNVNPYSGQIGTKNPYGAYGSTSGSPSYGNYSNPYSSSSSSGQSRGTCLYYTPC
jgi:hypothetical protein